MNERNVMDEFRMNKCVFEAARAFILGRMRIGYEQNNNLSNLRNAHQKHWHFDRITNWLRDLFNLYNNIIITLVQGSGKREH